MNKTKEISEIASICIVIPTYNRADLLAKSLAKYLSVKYIERVTVMIVDNNSNDHTARVVQDFHITSKLNVVYLHESTQGLSYAKNRAIEECESPYLLFLDDDCYPDTDILIHCAYHVSQGLKAVVGKIRRWQDMVPKWNLDEFFIQNYPSNSFVTMPSSTYFKGGIVLLSTDLLRTYSGFDVRLGMMGEESNYGEDTDLAERLLADNHKIFYDPSMVMFHCSHQKTFLAYCKAYYALAQKSRTDFGKWKAILYLVKAICLAPFIFMQSLLTHRYIKTAMVKASIPVATALGRLQTY